MIYIIWLTLFALVVFSFLSNGRLPIWVPISGYIVVIIFRTKEKMGNYYDWKKINIRDEKLKLQEVALDMAEKGLTFSSIRDNEEKKVKKDFEFERKKKKREFENQLIDSLFLK